jgi:hypothetical protein
MRRRRTATWHAGDEKASFERLRRGGQKTRQLLGLEVVAVVMMAMVRTAMCWSLLLLLLPLSAELRC